MKRLRSSVIAVLLILCMVALSACGGSASSAAPAASPSQADSSAPAQTGGSGTPDETAAASGQTYKIINILRLAGDSYWDTIARGYTQFGEDTGHEIINISPTESDAAQQLTILQDAIAQQPDAITIVPISNDACEPLLKQAMEAGIVVITGEGVGMENHDWDLAGLNTENYGNHAMDELAKAMGEEGEYMLMAGSLTNSGHMSRLNQMIKRQEELYPNMTLASGEIVAPTAGTADSHLALFKEMLTTYPNIKGIFAHESTAQAALAVEEAGKIGQVSVMGYCMPDEAGQYLESGAMTLSIIGDPVAKGAATCALAVKVLDGEEIVDGIDLGYVGFDAAVVDVDKKSVQANGFIDINKDNYKDFDF